ncbi:MAG: serine/threonine protein kinase [Terriglobales bacterium]
MKRKLDVSRYLDESLPTAPQISDMMSPLTMKQRIGYFLLQVLCLGILAGIWYFAVQAFPAVAQTVSDALVQLATMARQNIMMFWICSAVVAVVMFLLRRSQVLPPTHISISSDRFRLYRTDSAIGAGEILSLPWQEIRTVSLVPSGKSSSEDTLKIGTKFGFKKEIKVGFFGEHSIWETFFKTLRERAPDAVIDPEVYQMMEAPPDNNYTELWLSALSAPPQRERMAPLAPKTALKDGLYIIREQLGTGGQGTAYVAMKLDRTAAVTEQDPKRRETVVLKEYVLPVHVMRAARKGALESLQAEAQLLKTLDNPHIVKLVDFFVEDHRGYLTFEHVRGKNLKQIVAEQGAMPETRVRELALQMCEMLHYLHGQSPPVVHRDFTPDNLILDENGNLKLIDFNVAHQYSGNANATATVVGKQAYLPPEQFRGKPCPQSDIYALGGTLYFLLTGKEPEALSVLHPAQAAADVSVQLDAAVARCTQLEHESRFASAAELQSALKSTDDGAGKILLTEEKERVVNPPVA